MPAFFRIAAGSGLPPNHPVEPIGAVDAGRPKAVRPQSSHLRRSVLPGIVVTVLGMVAEMERKFILERQRAGIEAAKARGIYAGVGLSKSVPEDEIRRRHAAGEGPTQIAKALGIGRTSVYRALANLRP